MGIFSKTPKPNPKITFECIEFTFHRDHEWWEFTYRGAEFCSFTPTLSLPTRAELDSIVSTVESLRPDMRKRLAKGLAEWGDGCKLDDGETCSISLEEFATDRSFSVSWSDGASWGDLGVDFTIKDHAIVDESWGD
jgi:hypothetical protein